MLQLRHESENDGNHMSKDRDRLGQWIKKLKIELEAGHKELDKLDATRARLREWIPRITVAIQMLEEEIKN